MPSASRVPTHLKLLRGNPGKRPLPPEPQPLQPINLPEPPEFLMEAAKNEWWRISDELHRLGLLTIADLNPLAAYCQAYARWASAEEALAKMAAHDTATKALLIKGTHGNPAQNPLVKIAASAARDMVRYAAEFGLTPVARARIAAGWSADRPASKFDGLLAG